LRERIATKLARVNGIRVQPELIVCGVGGVGVISAAISALCDAGDEVLIPDPGWPSYRLSLAVAQARVVPYPCPPELGFLPDLERLNALITARSKVLLVNSPNNPTGAVYTAEMLTALGELSGRHGLWVISDECYDQVVLDGSAVASSMRDHADPERNDGLAARLRDSCAQSGRQHDQND
jgi:aspartate/methionine/tyrosine aminotransferase